MRNILKIFFFFIVQMKIFFVFNVFITILSLKQLRTSLYSCPICSMNLSDEDFNEICFQRFRSLEKENLCKEFLSLSKWILSMEKRNRSFISPIINSLFSMFNGILFEMFIKISLSNSM